MAVDDFGSPEAFMAAVDATIKYFNDGDIVTGTVVKVDRGGSVTYHGPGQVIVYPIVRVRLPKDVVAFVRAVEAAVIEALSTFGVRGERIAGRSGVWVGGEKICAVGLKFASDTTMHGLALNVTTDVSKFFRVNPCGITDAGVTSMERQGVDASLEEAAAALTSALGKHLASFQQER